MTIPVRGFWWATPCGRTGPGPVHSASTGLHRGDECGELRVVGRGSAGPAGAVGLVTGFLGVGGGFLVVPVLVLGFGLPMPLAVGTSLLVILVNSAVALAARLHHGSAPHWPILLWFAAAAVAGGLAGARVVSRVSPQRLSTALAVVLVVVATYVGARSVPSLI
ncbi:TSUP family transporter [Phytohabitans kaempferiae]|uniref:Probable membrane transporter protein n=1 Tax=Phytohabitans kaempferiae TaxID=1620943 RepID=A0ABV6M8L5_9ACTN